MMNIVPHTKIKEELKRERKFLRNIIATIPDSLLVLDKDLRIKSANRSFYKLFQTGPKKVIGSKITDILGGENGKLSARLTKLFGTKGILKNFELHYHSEKLGERIFNIIARGTIVAEEELVVIQDISERKRAEEALQESEKKYRTTFENTGTAMAIIEEDTTISLVNHQFEILTGYSKEEIEGKKGWTEFVHEQDLERMKEYHRKRRESGGKAPTEYEFRFVDREGNIKNIFLTVEVIPGTKKSITSLMNITERKRTEEQLENSFIDLAETVSRAMEARDPYTSGHQRRVAELACLVGEKMGLDKNRLQGLHIGGLLHDIGKISTPESILSKPGELADEEWSLIHAHAKQGYLILKGTSLPWPVADMALHHHERLDGSGYPHGISGDKLSLEVRILGVCDVVEAMSSHRPYRPARSMAEILKELRSGRGTKYDANVVDVMLEIIENGEFEVGGEVSRQL